MKKWTPWCPLLHDWLSDDLILFFSKPNSNYYRLIIRELKTQFLWQATCKICFIVSKWQDVCPVFWKKYITILDKSSDGLRRLFTFDCFFPVSVKDNVDRLLVKTCLQNCSYVSAIVFDRYREETIKGATLTRHTMSARPIRRLIECHDVPLPKN